MCIMYAKACMQRPTTTSAGGFMGHYFLYLLGVKKNKRFYALRCRKVGLMPYMKFKNWYVPNCDIAFPTEEEAWEYLEEEE